ncbi:hypothetical protein HanRHA438_Chr01g0026101 [Helianthus annuus]|nr:hypothetical protein HanRHA438_Chr01g0026101 [Helianthus annuus]KAJ0957230.1 hypothetical protein HanPSC8_Chr01g0024821 [Helianthus annuus]
MRCSQGQVPTIDRFRVFYQLQSNLGLFSFASCGVAKKILISAPKSFHGRKDKFFYIHEEVIPIAMTFRTPEVIEKKILSVPKSAEWYRDLLALPNQYFGENTLVATGMSDRWPQDSVEVPIFLQDGVEKDLYHRAFPACSGIMGARQLREGEQMWYDQIRGNSCTCAQSYLLHPQLEMKVRLT